MNVELIWDVGDIPECSVIQDVREEGDSYIGLWCSFQGSYEVTVPKASSKPSVPDSASTEDVRGRVLTRWGLGRRTKAPVGAGNYVPGVKVFLVGERTSHPEKNKHHAPFCSTKACSGWLNKLLCEANIDERDLFWVNALDNDGTPVDLGSMHSYLKPVHAFALGKTAERQLAVYNIAYTAFTHPQYWKRFRSKEPYPLINALGKL